MISRIIKWTGALENFAAGFTFKQHTILLYHPAPLYLGVKFACHFYWPQKGNTERTCFFHRRSQTGFSNHNKTTTKYHTIANMDAQAMRRDSPTH
jgi:hypothetical protein